eukprot:scaffold29263_cov34-Phaeocystis_antarctica.AAC.2
MINGSRVGDFGQAPERQRRLSSRGQRAAGGCSRWVAASAAVSQGTLTMLRCRACGGPTGGGSRRPRAPAQC